MRREAGNHSHRVVGRRADRRSRKTPAVSTGRGGNSEVIFELSMRVMTCLRDKLVFIIAGDFVLDLIVRVELTLGKRIGSALSRIIVI